MNKHDEIDGISISTYQLAKYYAVVLTITYVLLFPCFFYMGLLSGMLLENPKTTVAQGLFMMFAVFWIPFSMPVSIYYMWSNFSLRKYKNIFYWGLLPLATLAVVLLLIDGLIPSIQQVGR